MALILPQIDDLNRPYWDGAKQGVLRLQRCTCGGLRYPISPVCPACLSGDYEWDDVPGGGEVYSFAVFRHVYNDAWSGRVPYAVAIVRLDEGLFVIADLVGVEVDDVQVGMPVSVRFDDVTPDITVPRFGPR